MSCQYNGIIENYYRCDNLSIDKNDKIDYIMGYVKTPSYITKFNKKGVGYEHTY